MSPIQGRYLLAFFALTILCGTSHEFIHHFVGAAICGCFGYKTFNSFELCSGCVESNPYWTIATFAGPVFTFALVWWGLFLLQKSNPIKKQLGFALIFANFPINRLVFAFMGFNDEQYAVSVIFGGDNLTAFWLTNLVVSALTLPPLIYGYKAIGGKHRLLSFIGYLILPFVFVIVFAGLFLEEWLLLEKRWLAETVIGIPYLILLVEILSMVIYFLYKKHLYESPLIQLK